VAGPGGSRGRPGKPYEWIFGGLRSLDCDAWIAWAEPWAYGLLALKPWEFERIGSTRVFDLLLRGAIRRQQLQEDLIGHLRLAIYVANGVKFSRRAADAPIPPDHPTFERLMGRAPVPYVDPPPKTDAERAREEETEREAEEKRAKQAALLAQAQLQLWEAQVRANRPGMIDESPPGQHEEPVT
jgi:hypothetical protein